VATDASAFGWGGSLILPVTQNTSDYWTDEEMTWDIATKEATAIERVLLAFQTQIENAWVDAMVDNQAVIHAWNNQGGRSASLNKALKKLFFTTIKLNILLRLSYIPTKQNPADQPSRVLSKTDCQLSPHLWQTLEQHFGGPQGHTVDLMALDSNAMKNRFGVPLPHFTPYPSPESTGVNFFAQDLAGEDQYMMCPYISPPLVLIGPVLRYLKSYKKSCTIVILDTYPRKYWWPILQLYSKKSLRIACEGDRMALLVPSKGGWVNHLGIPGDLWAFSVLF
jgi:hypothetical protein